MQLPPKRGSPLVLPHSGGQQHSAVDEIGRVLDQPPVLVGEVLRGQTRFTRRWTHGAIHDQLPGMADHVVMTYYGAAQEVGWREGGERLSTRTRVGSITLIPQGHEGRWDIGGPIEVSHVYLSDERLRSSAEAIANGRPFELIHRVAFDDPVASRILTMLSEEEGEGSSRLFVEQAIDLLCTQLLRGHSSLATMAPPPRRRGLADWQVKRVTRYMQDHLDDEDMGLDELAALVNLSRFHFVTAFRLATGQPPHAWLTALRIGQARRLLAQPELAVTEVALSVGYQTPSAFAASFRKAVGMTPSEFRRRL